MGDLNGGEVFFFDAHHPCFADEYCVWIVIFYFCGEAFPEFM